LEKNSKTYNKGEILVILKKMAALAKKFNKASVNICYYDKPRGNEILKEI